MTRTRLLFLSLLLGCTTTEYLHEDVTGVAFEVDSLVLSPGESVALATLPFDQGGNRVGVVVDLSSSDTLVLRVQSPDSVVAVGNGAAFLRAEADGVIDSIPVRVVTSWAIAAFGDERGCVGRPTGALWCKPIYSSDPFLPFTTPVAIEQLTAGYFHLCGIATDQSAWCWGRGDEGQLGLGYSTGYVNEAAPVAGGHTFAMISAGFWHSCGVTLNGTGLCWGDGTNGSLGGGDTLAAFAPDTIAGGLTWSSIAAGTGGSCGITTSQALYCWGYLLPAADSLPDRLVPRLVTGVPAVSEVATTASGHTCALDGAGVPWCWGASLVYPAPDILTPAALSGGPALVSIVAAGYSRFCGLEAGGAAWCWGEGGLGDGSWEASPTPRQVAGGHWFVRLAGGSGGAVGITAGGAAWYWGRYEPTVKGAEAPRRVIDP